MEINNWINKNYNRLLDNATRITRDKETAQDVLHQCLTEFLSYPDDKRERLFKQGKLENYLTMCINIQFKSSTSPYHKIHRKQNMMETEYFDWKHDSITDEERSEYDIQCDCIFNSIDKLHWYYKTLLTKKFIEGMTYQELHVYYGISKNSLLKDIKIGIEMLKQICL